MLYQPPCRRGDISFSSYDEKECEGDFCSNGQKADCLSGTLWENGMRNTDNIFSHWILTGREIFMGPLRIQKDAGILLASLKAEDVLK